MRAREHWAAIHPGSVLPKKEANTKNNIFINDYDISSVAEALRLLCKSHALRSLQRRGQPRRYQRTVHDPTPDVRHNLRRGLILSFPTFLLTNGFRRSNKTKAGTSASLLAVTFIATITAFWDYSFWYRDSFFGIAFRSASTKDNELRQKNHRVERGPRIWTVDCFVRFRRKMKEQHCNPSREIKDMYGRRDMLWPQARQHNHFSERAASSG